MEHVVSPHLIGNTNQIDFSERIESLKTVNHSMIKLRLSEKIYLSNLTEQLEKYLHRINVHASHQNEVRIRA